MITRLVVKNFQGHKRLDVKFGPVTTIVGRSNIGKSALIRAIRWVVGNRPSGTGIVRHGADTAIVGVVLDDGRKVSRVRGGSRNEYRLDGKKFVAFGSGKVPDEVADCLNVSPVSFQHQLDGPYWLSDTAGEVSKKLNGVINLGLMDRVLGELGRRVRRAKGRADDTAARLKAARAELKSLDWADRFLAAAAGLKRLEEKACETEKSKIRLADLLSELKAVAAASPVPDLAELSVVREAADRAAEARRKLDAELVELKEADQHVAVLTRQLADAERELETGTAGRCPLCRKPM